VNGEKMASLWQFFGLPDPDGQSESKKRVKKADAASSKPLEKKTTEQQTLETPVRTLHEPEKEVAKSTPLSIDTISTVTRQKIPSKWKGPLTAEGEAFHDLGAHSRVQNSFPRRALRYVSPDEKNRIPTREMSKRILQGDSVIVDLRPMVHMDTHQNVCRRELQQMSNESGVGIFALDAEDKLLLLPGKDVVVDVGRHELGLLSLMTE
tara:strand:+ start:882 stop:1505 length:624 start_codon:yes stop_codon:yes gene_type:complete